MNRRQFLQTTRELDSRRRQRQSDTTRERVARIVAASQPKDAS